jgi:hypothetical protein
MKRPTSPAACCRSLAATRGNHAACTHQRHHMPLPQRRRSAPAMCRAVELARHGPQHVGRAGAGPGAALPCVALRHPWPRRFRCPAWAIQPRVAGQGRAGTARPSRPCAGPFRRTVDGGGIGQWLGIHAPQRLHKLVLANTAARIGSFDGWTSRAATVRAAGLADIAAGAAGRWFSPAFATAQPGVIAGMQETLRRQDPEAYAACCDALASADLREVIRSIDVSTLIIAGSEDPVTTVADATSMRDSIAGPGSPRWRRRTCRTSKQKRPLRRRARLPARLKARRRAGSPLRKPKKK